MSIYKTAIDKPITTALIFVAVVIIGIFSYVQLPVDQFPEMDPPYVTVMTTYPGASASEIETNVTKLMENSLNSVDGLKKLTSTSKDNISMVLMEFEWGTDLTEAVNDVRSYIEMTKDNLPDACSTPFVFKFSSSAMPIAQYAITAKESYPGLDKLLNDEVVPQLNRVNGIGNLTLSGTPERYVYVDIDQAKLDAYGIPLETVGQAISGNNLNLSSGTVKMEKEQYQMQVRSEYLESEEINNIIVTTTFDGKQVYVRDLATVRDTIKDLSLDEKTNGQESVRLIVSKQSGGNTVQICRDLRKELDIIRKQLPSDVKISEIYDSSTDIQNSIDSLKESIGYALLFVVLVVLFFLGRWRAALIISLTIPISLIVAFIYLKFGADSSLNIISLCSLTVAIGMVVDDAIVVLENIMKHIERGSRPREAAIYATNEVWVSVIATTLVIVAVFVPLTMLPGMAGIMFKELGWIVTIVVCTSTAIAISLTPMLCSKLLKAKKVKVVNGEIVEEADQAGWYQKYVVSLLDKLDQLYARLLHVCLTHRWTSIGILAAFFVLSLIPMMLGWIGTDFMQQQDNGRITVKIELVQGSRIEETIKTARRLEARFQELVPEIRLINSSAGSQDDGGMSALFNNTTNNKIQMTVNCGKKYQRKRDIFTIAEILRKEMANYPEIIDYSAQISSGMGGGGAQTVDVEIYGYDFDKTSAMANEFKYTIQQEVSGARDVMISRDKDRSELKIIVDKEKATRMGLSSAMISSYLRNRVNGMSAGYLKEDGDEYNIMVRLKEDDRNSTTDIENLTIPTPTGRQVKLSEIASIGEYWAPPTIERKSRQRYVKVSVTPHDVSLGELATQIQAVVDKTSLPQGIVVRLAGSYEDQQENFSNMGLLMILIVILVYIVMASQFESLSKPAIIMLAVPFAISGVILALLITRTSLDMIGALGVIMLVGIVVKNGIVLVDYIDLMRERGYEMNTAIEMSGASRLRPVLMTAFTTILGMVPMALSTGVGSEMWRPMGIVVIGGLLVSTIITLLIVPVFYSLMSKSDKDRQEERRREFIFMQLSADSTPKDQTEEK
ncbi:MAG: efflux RND transporter permease subunit [Paludibacteraceae bacterium]|nr:efflux RND transporter permease subunit [Paludibacteraceae bacterium]